MRIKYSVARHKRKKKILKMAKGYYGDKKSRLRQAKQQVKKGLTAAYEHRKDKKGDMRRLWIARINAAVREEGMSYSKFISGLKKAEINLNRKMLSEMAIRDADSFRELVKLSKNALAA